MSNTDADIICARLDERLKAMHDSQSAATLTLGEIKALVTATNGRVRELEAWRARTDGQKAIITVVAVAIIGALAKLYIGG